MKIAYHETGHAVMMLISGHGVQNVSLKERLAPNGIDKYLGSATPLAFEKKPMTTVDELDRKVMISLAGYMSEALFFDGLISSFGSDDLNRAIQYAENMLESEQFKSLVSQMPTPEAGKLDMISNPLVRQYIDQAMGRCHMTLGRLKPVIHLLAVELDKKDELSGEEFGYLFDLAVERLQNPN